eukprot:TRINITY_DN1837_c0_g1_i6.p1 TRINITY_DN1837_c0_g1~~TRINITY_DN1837_c0_g1_i6.p1  ORF type:complete len:294 (-),score=17.35 TRINITY_DN1837_c0_g1_i6:60-941(-)
MINYDELSDDAPLADAFRSQGAGWAGTLISIGCVIGSTTSAYTGLLGQPRIYFSMSRDGLFFPIFLKKNKNDVPSYGVLITCIFVGTIAFLVPLETLSDMVSIGTLNAFAIVNASVLVMRYKPHGEERNAATWVIMIFNIAAFIMCELLQNYLNYYLLIGPCLFVIISFVYLLRLTPHPSNIPTTFKCPAVPWTPCIGNILVFYVLSGLGLDAWYRFIIWMFIGFCIYFGYGIFHSRLRNASTTPQLSAQHPSDSPYFNDTDKERDRKSGSAGMPRPISYAVFCLKKKKRVPS